VTSPFANDAAAQSAVNGNPVLQQGPVVATDLGDGLEALQQTLPSYMRAEEYYGGDVPEVFASARMRWAMRRTGMSFKFNFAKTPVDALTDRLEISAVTSSNPNITAELADLWEDNQLDLEAPNIHRKAGQYGDAYVIVWPAEEPDDDSYAPEGTDLGVQIVEATPNIGIYYNSPENCRMLYDAENPLKKRLFIKRWQLPRTKQWRVDLLYSDRIERYISQVGKRGDEAAEYISYTDAPGDEWPMPNPFGAIPAFHFRNDRPYGNPEHYGFYGPQDAINKLIMLHMAGADYQSFPQRYAMVKDESDTTEPADLAEDEFAFPIPGTGDTVPVGREARSTLTSDPGSFWNLKGVDGVGQFDVADPDVFMRPITMYLKSGAQITTTPLHYFDPGGDAPSGESLRTAEAPFVKKVRNRQLSYGATWRDVMLFALHCMGIDGVDVAISWSPAHTVDDLAGWQTNEVKAALGVPRRQLLLDAGYTSDQVDEWDKAGLLDEPEPAPLPPVALALPSATVPPSGTDDGNAPIAGG
jgi:hypothetical protein